MPFTADDCERLTGERYPDYYLTPPQPSLCKNNVPSLYAIPCWYPHCDCMPPKDPPFVVTVAKAAWSGNVMAFWFCAKWLGILGLFLFSFASIVFLGVKLGWI